MSRPVALRIVALVASAALVVGALVVRSRRDDGGGSGPGDDRRVSVVCMEELATACETLAGEQGWDLTVEPAGATADRLATTRDARAAPDAWVVAAGWPELVEARRRAGGLEPLLDAPSGPVARTPLVLAMFPERRAALAPTCGGTVDWRCLGEHAGRPWSDVGGEPGWGTLEVAIPDPTRTATGLAVLAQAASERLARTDFGRDDLALDDAFLTWFRRLTADAAEVARVEATGSTPLDEMLSAGRPSFAATGAGAAAACAPVRRAAADRRPALSYPAPVATLDAVVAARRGPSPGVVAGAFASPPGRAALLDAGWSVAGRPPDPDCGAPALPPGSNLPDAVGAAALQELWASEAGR